MTDPTADPAGNPLLRVRELPAFSAIKPEHVEPAVRELLAAQRRALEHAEGVAAPDVDWLRGLELIHTEFDRVWGPVNHLNAVLSSPPLRDAFNRCLPLVTEFYTELGQNETLYRHFNTLHARVGAEQFVERQLIANALRDFRLGGVALKGQARERFKAVMQELAADQAKFEQNVMDATDAFEHREADRGALAGLPDFVIERARALAAERGEEGWHLRLDPPTYQTVLAHAESAPLRAKYYEAWVTRASDQGPHAGRFDNGELIGRIMALRHEAAQLVGFKTFAEFSLATKVAESPARVIEFLHDLASRSRNVALEDVAKLSSYAGRKLEAWDVPFYAERFKQEKLDLAEEELRPYFPLPRVLDGMFSLCGRLFDLTIAEAHRPDVWHDSVRYYELKRADGSLVGSFFTDLFARPNKRGGAWMGGCASRARLNGHAQLPVAYLVCNFNAGSGDTPSLLTHSELVTLFHEFGHTLHHVLTEVDYPSLAGTNGVAWDAVELPSQFLENFTWRPEVLSEIGRHYRTGAPLPHDKIDTLNRSRTFLAGLGLVRQIEFALFDFRLHDEYQPARGARVAEILAEVRREVAVVEPPACNRFAHSFSHVFGGGYAAGYYSYKWAEVLAADAFAAFVEAGVFDRATAERFRRAVLATGGSRNALDAFVEFRGRQPTLDALLEQSGIARRR
ncbi:MAG TPA: M3 family metallopeptidase [Gammaproteobacteria bacterium]|nr:M3 family metallopeptidase [Gammaproteobacteria bacterium]